MTRRMSCSMTIDAVRTRRKTVTRRSADAWHDLQPGDHLTLVEKAMGLPKGSTQVVLAEVEVIDVRVEPLYDITDDDIQAEGFGDMDLADFIDMWLEGHRVPPFQTQNEAMSFPVRRIEWRYLDEERTS